MQLLPVQRRKMLWTRGLQLMCRLLKRHKRNGVAENASFIPFVVAGQKEVDMKVMSRIAKFSNCSLPHCNKYDTKLQEKFKRCKRCAVAKYCSKEHQVEHWKVHKRECKKHN